MPGCMVRVDVAPALFTMSSRKNRVLRQALLDYKWIADLGIIFNESLTQFVQIFTGVCSISLLPEVPDSISWKLMASSSYFAKSAYLAHLKVQLGNHSWSLFGVAGVLRNASFSLGFLFKIGFQRQILCPRRVLTTASGALSIILFRNQHLPSHQLCLCLPCLAILPLGLAPRFFFQQAGRPVQLRRWCTSYLYGQSGRSAPAGFLIINPSMLDLSFILSELRRLFFVLYFV